MFIGNSILLYRSVFKVFGFKTFFSSFCSVLKTSLGRNCTTAETENRKMNNNRNNHTVLYQDNSTSTGSCTQRKPASPLFWLVSQCYNVLLCIFFFFTYECLMVDAFVCL